MAEIKLIALDIDQTLVCGKDVISERNLQAIRAAQEKGVHVTLATGRGFLSSKKIWEQMDLKGPSIHYGGAMIVNSPDGKPIIVHALDEQLVHEVLEYCHELGIHVQIFDGDTVVAEKDCEFFTFYHNRTNLPFRIDPELRSRVLTGVPKILAYSKEDDHYCALIGERFKGRCDVSISSPGFIEINGLGVSKGEALCQLAEWMNIPRESVAALGDSTLDLSMIRWAGYGVCMQDGKPAVLAEADIIAPPASEDGVAGFIEQYVL